MPIMQSKYSGDNVRELGTKVDNTDYVTLRSVLT
jgi:hypothetical protein